jgi:hypothetical protein
MNPVGGFLSLPMIEIGLRRRTERAPVHGGGLIRGRTGGTGAVASAGAGV